MEATLLAALVVVLILIIYVWKPTSMDKKAETVAEVCVNGECVLEDCDGVECQKEAFTSPGETSAETSPEWVEYLKEKTLDPAIHEHQANYVKDVRNFSSPVSRAISVADDNNNPIFTNFVGFFRPQHVPIGASARQQPDVDQTVLQRNSRMTWSFK